MEQFWRNTGIQLGKQWKIVFVVMLVITGVLALGASKIEFATGQDSYLNPESQIALDNVAFQDDFGGETIILLFSAEGDTKTPELFAGDNLAELRRITDEISAVPEVYSTVTPAVSLTYSSELVGGPTGTQALTGALGRDEAGAEARSADISISLARRGAAGPSETWTLDNPDWVELLIFSNEGYVAGDDGVPVAPAIDDRIVRSSLQGTFPNPDPDRIHQTAVGGIILNGNASLDEQSVGTDKVVEILEDAEFDGFELTITGSPIYLGEINDYLKGGTLTLGLAALAVMALVLGLIFKVRWRLLPLLAVIIGVLWSFSILGLIGISLSLVTIAGLPILIGIGIDFAIQIHNRVEEEVVLDQEAHPIAETVANVAPPLIAATITGVLAFLALRISKVPMIRDFGVLLAIGVVVLVTVGIIVPIAALGIREWTDRTDERGESAVEKLVVKLGGLPARIGPALIGLAVILAIGGVAVEGRTKIQSDPIKWIDQGSETVTDIDRLADETEFASTLGVLVTSNNVFDQQVVDLIYDFTQDAEARPEVIATSSLVGTVEKIIDIPGATPLSPTSGDIENAYAAANEVTPDIAKVLVNADQTAAQINLRLAQGSLEDRSVLVDELAADLDARLDALALDVPAESILLTDLPAGQDPVKATPAGLATVGIGLLENLSANRANLTYLALALAALFLVVRLRSLSRALLALVPVLMAVGASSLFVGLLGFELSPLTTVSGPLVIATCAEFSVLILGRYLEERQNGLSPRESTNTAAGRTGRAFFTSAMTTIGGFAVLIVSPLPLLRDFGIIVTLNVAIALLAALVAMPPLSVWVDEKGWLGTQEQGTTGAQSVRMGAVLPGKQTIGAAIGAVALLIGVFAVYSSADTSTGEVDTVAFAAQPLPTTTTTTTTTVAPPPTVAGEQVPDGPLIDPSTFGDERPTSVVGGVLFDLFTSPEVGVAPNVANCAIETLATRISDDDLIALGAATGEPAAVEVVAQAAVDCGITDNQIVRAVASLRNEPLPPVEEPSADDAAASAVPEIDLSGFSEERPTDLVQGTVFDLLVGGGDNNYEGQGIEPAAANCAIETTIADFGDTTLTLLAAGDPVAVANVKLSVATCGIAPELVDGAALEFSGG